MDNIAPTRQYRSIMRVYAVALLFLLSASAASAATGPSPVALLQLVPLAPDEYAVLPTQEQARGLTMQIRSGLTSSPLHLELIPQSRIPANSCSDADCARHIAATLGARTVIFGIVDRFGGVKWNVQLTAVDVQTGRTVDTVTFGAFGTPVIDGDYDTILNSIREAGVCMGRSIAGKSPCTSSA
jgi:hypothetical protein